MRGNYPLDKRYKFKNSGFNYLGKGKIGMGYRTSRKSEYLLVLQKHPVKAKGHWARHDIPDIWTEKINDMTHPHQKPLTLRKIL
jgi:site-specific DNA-methyltransferase (adenine-specific)